MLELVNNVLDKLSKHAAHSVDVSTWYTIPLRTIASLDYPIWNSATPTQPAVKDVFGRISRRSVLNTHNACELVSVE